MKKPFFALLFLSLAAYGQQQERIAIIQTVDNRDSVGFSELAYLTDILREIAVNVLPKSRYAVMSTESIIAFLGSQEQAAKVCNESSCLADIGRKVNADYVAQARIGRFEGDLTIKAELYSSKSGAMVGSFTGDSKTLQGLRNIIDEKAPILLRKMPGASGGTKAASPAVVGGISGLESTVGSYEANYEKSYLANISTEPAGAALSFNGIPIGSCPKTPCKAELPEGSIRIIAALEQYETADTTVSIKQNKQSINIKLKPNFGVLEIKPAYSDGIGSEKGWNLAVNGKPQSSYENKLSPGNYEVKLNHECYEDISFKAGINKGRREVFDMAKHIELKKGGLVLSAEVDGEPVIEPVFVNGKQVGETPFSGTVPVCAEISIGSSKVDAKIAYKQTVEHKHKMNTEEWRLRQEEELETERERTAWMMGIILLVSGGYSFNLNNIDHYLESAGVQWTPLNIEFYKRNLEFLRFGFNIDFGAGGIDKDAVKRLQPNLVDSLDDACIHFKVHTFARLYPVNFLFLTGGAGWDIFYASSKQGTKPSEDVDVVNISTPVFPVGGGICLYKLAGGNSGFGLVIEGLYNIVPFKGRTAAYITINIGFKLDSKEI